jgi:hypothetical protein
MRREGGAKGGGAASRGSGRGPAGRTWRITQRARTAVCRKSRMRDVQLAEDAPQTARKGPGISGGARGGTRAGSAGALAPVPLHPQRSTITVLVPQLQPLPQTYKGAPPIPRLRAYILIRERADYRLCIAPPSLALQLSSAAHLLCSSLLLLLPGCTATAARTGAWLLAKDSGAHDRGCYSALC